jgi:hypothetical protein
MYFFFAVPLTFMAATAMLPAARPLYRRAGLAAVLGLSVVGLVFFAAPFRSLVPGKSSRLVPPSEHRLPRCSIRLGAATVDLYRQILDLADREVAPDEAILVLPGSPELYYLTGRRNPTRFGFSILGLRSRGDVGELVRRIDSAPPRLVFYTPNMNFDSDHTREVMASVAAGYDHVGEYGPFHVYRSRARRGDAERTTVAPPPG